MLYKEKKALLASFITTLTAIVCLGLAGGCGLGSAALGYLHNTIANETGMHVSGSDSAAGHFTHCLSTAAEKF